MSTAVTGSSLPGPKRFRTEADVGITQRLGTHKRFHATVKERFSHFHVNEVDPDGNIVHLTSLGLPLDPDDEKRRAVQEDPRLLTLVPEESRKNIAAFQEYLATPSVPGTSREKRDDIEIEVTDVSKEDRTKIHMWISSFGKLDSDTIEKNGRKVIRIAKKTGNHGMKRRPASRGRYTHCVLYKEGVATPEAISVIARKLNLKPSLISYAGIKDRRAKTAQRVAISNIEASRLIGVCKYSKGIKLGNFEYKDKPIALGELKGNHFQLLLNNLTLVDSSVQVEDVVKNSVEFLESVGFINYYGLQRFGSFEVSTCEIGKCVLQQKWIEAFDLILQPTENDSPWMLKAKRLWLNERHPEESVGLIPSHHRSVESSLLYGLAQFYDTKNYIGAFTKIPRNQRLLYVHAYQSFLWNLVASFRVEKYGLKPVPGDLVYASTDGSEPNDPLNVEDLDMNLDTDIALQTVYKKPDVTLITEDDIEASKYSIYDVLVPLYGVDVKYPDNEVKNFLQKQLEIEGVSDDCYRNFKPPSDRALGAYRRLVVLPKDVAYEVRPHGPQDNLDTFISSDWEMLESGPSKSTSRDTKEKLVEEGSEIVKDRKCLVVKFSLPSSSYATMALRELMESELGVENASKTGSNSQDFHQKIDSADNDDVNAGGAKRSKDV